MVAKIPQEDSRWRVGDVSRTRDTPDLCREDLDHWSIKRPTRPRACVPLGPPCIAPSDIAHQLKGTTARLAFQAFPEIKKQLWGGALWSRSYYVGSVGDMSVETVLKYIELGQD